MPVMPHSLSLLHIVIAPGDSSVRRAFQPMDIGSDVDLTDINVTKFSNPLSRETEDLRVEDTRNST